MSNKCSWCNKVKALLPGKRYCERCDSASFQECRRCRRPLDHAKYFTLDPSGSRCNACQRKFLRERAMATTSKQSGSSKITMMPSSDSEICTLSDEADESCGEFKIKSVVKKPPVKRRVVFKRQQQPSAAKKRKVQQQAPSGNLEELLKELLCKWSGEPDCIQKILNGKKLAFIPVIY